MIRREMLGALGAGAAGLVAMSATAQAQDRDREKYRYRSMLDKTHVDCLDACMACAAVCGEASHHCLEELKEGHGSKDQHSRSHHLTMDCGDMCALAAELVGRMSPLMGEQCSACADACKRCAEECEKGGNVEIMKECARICRECERACRDMARAHHARSTSPG